MAILTLQDATDESWKTCGRCDTQLPRDAFNKDATKHDGLQGYCRNCQIDYKRENYVRVMWNSARLRAFEKGVPFTIEVEDIFIPKCCPVLGIPLTAGGHSDNSPSLDRIVPATGYVRNNIQVISNRANRIKNDATLEELRAVLFWLERVV